MRLIRSYKFYLHNQYTHCSMCLHTTAFFLVMHMRAAASEPTEGKILIDASNCLQAATTTTTVDTLFMSSEKKMKTDSISINRIRFSWKAMRQIPMDNSEMGEK